MTKRCHRLIPITLATLLLAACNGHIATASPKPGGRQAITPREESLAALRSGVRITLAANYRLSVYVLWHNAVPGWATQSTRGPALASLRSASRTRRERGIRVRMLSDHRTTGAVTLNRARDEATVIVVDRQRVQPSNHRGDPLGAAVSLDERAQYELRRVGTQMRFVVWQVTELQ